MTFFDGYSYKQKNYALAILAVLLLAASYKRAFSVTIETIRNKNELILKMEESKSALNNIRVAQIEIASLNKLLGKENVTIEKVQQGFLNFLTRKSQNVSVYQVEEVLKYQHPDFSINTHRIILKGNFLNILKFLYKLEKEFDLAKLVNVSFEHKKYSVEENEQLYTVILLQNYER